MKAHAAWERSLGALLSFPAGGQGRCPLRAAGCDGSSSHSCHGATGKCVLRMKEEMCVSLFPIATRARVPGPSEPPAKAGTHLQPPLLKCNKRLCSRWASGCPQVLLSSAPLAVSCAPALCPLFPHTLLPQEGHALCPLCSPKCAPEPAVLAKPTAVALGGTGGRMPSSPARAPELPLAAFRGPRGRSALGGISS